MNNSNSNTSRSTSTNNLTNINKINNPNEEVKLVENNVKLHKHTEANKKVKLIENTVKLHEYTKENKKLLEKMYENMNKIKNQNLYLNTELKNQNKQEDLKALQNYVKTQRVIFKKISDNIKEVNNIKKKHRLTKLFMTSENKEKINKLLFNAITAGELKLHINSVVKNIKKIVNNNKRSKFRNMIKSKVSETSGKTSQERIAELKIERHDAIKNTKPMGRLLKY